jgi:hypothetical protein
MHQNSNDPQQKNQTWTNPHKIFNEISLRKLTYIQISWWAQNSFPYHDYQRHKLEYHCHHTHNPHYHLSSDQWPSFYRRHWTSLSLQVPLFVDPMNHVSQPILLPANNPQFIHKRNPIQNWKRKIIFWWLLLPIMRRTFVGPWP